MKTAAVIEDFGIPTKYTKWYLAICNNPNPLNEKYVEKHHILPRSIWPDYINLNTNKWNSAKLSAKQHFIAHYCLYKHYKKLHLEYNSHGAEYYKAKKAFIGMIFDRHGNRYAINASTYEILRKISSENMKGDNNPSKRLEVRTKIANTRNQGIAEGRIVQWNLGKEMSSETKEACSIGVTKYFENNVEARKNLADKATLNWESLSDETKLEINNKRSVSGKAYSKTPEGVKRNKERGIKQLGENNPMFGVPPKVKGGKWMNDGNIENIFHNIEEMQNSGWVIGRIKRNKNGNK